MLLKQVAAQNTSVQEPLNSAVQNIVQAIQMSAQAGSKCAAAGISAHAAMTKGE